MSLRVVFQMDPLSQLNVQRDSTLALIEEGHRRGHRLYHYVPSHLGWREERVQAWGAELKKREGEGALFSYEKLEPLMLEDFDLLFIRQDPPFDMQYMTTTYILEHLSGKVLMVNDPQGIRQSPEKILVTHFPSLMPPTLISQNEQDILDFLNQHEECVIKPLYGFGGESVVHMTRKDQKNIQPVLDLFCNAYPRQPWMIQKFLPEISQGDHRLFLLEGELMGGYKRVPASGSIRSNSARGGSVLAHTPLERDLEICQKIGPVLKKRGLFFVGIDIIGSYLIEINVTSPTGLRALDTLYSMNSAGLIWDALEKKF